MRERPGVAAWITLGLVVVTAAAIRLRLLDVPLDRDEGEYAYFGQLLLRGIPPYATAYNLKLPGVYGAYAAILWAFGQSPAGVHLGLLAANAAATVLVFALGARVLDTTAGVAAAAAFAGLSLSPRLHGLGGYAEHFVLLPALTGALVLVWSAESRRLAGFLASGALLGLAFVVKQSGGAFVLFGALYALRRTARAAAGGGWLSRIAPALLLLAGAALPYAALCLLLAWAGVFATFWFWTTIYAYQYGAALPLTDGTTTFLTKAAELLATSWALTALAAAGVTALFWDAPARRRRGFVLLFALGSFAGTSAGLYFRNQYFLLLAPAVALLAGVAADALSRLLAGATRAFRPVLAATLVLLPLAHLVWAERAVLFEMPPGQVARALYGLNPFPESVEIARGIKALSAPTDRIAVLGSEPQIYFYTGLPAATGFVYTYALMEAQPYAARMQRQMIDEIERANPRFVVIVNTSASWNVRPGSDRTLFQWWDRYQRLFERVGLADIGDGQTTYVWGPEAAVYTPKSLVWVAVLQRKVR